MRKIKNFSTSSMSKAILFIGLIFTLFSIYAETNSDRGGGCSVILLDIQWMIKSYDLGEKAFLDKNAKGEITVHETGDIMARSFKKERLPFRVGIKKSATQEYHLITENAVTSLLAEDLLKMCKHGDKIIIILDDSKYFLPHNTIEVVGGC